MTTTTSRRLRHADYDSNVDDDDTDKKEGADDDVDDNDDGETYDSVVLQV